MSISRSPGLSETDFWELSPAAGIPNLPALRMRNIQQGSSNLGGIFVESRNVYSPLRSISFISVVMLVTIVS